LRVTQTIERIGTLLCKGDAPRPRADSGGERQKTAQRRLKPSANTYRRKPGCDEKKREVQNTYHACNVHAEIVFSSPPPILL